MQGMEKVGGKGGDGSGEEEGKFLTRIAMRIYLYEQSTLLRLGAARRKKSVRKIQHERPSIYYETKRAKS